jgi:glycosyltransferase involved in cell wall biosynthesis
MSLPHLTIAFMTCRKEPMLDWFISSLHRECKGDFTGISIKVIDFYADSIVRHVDPKKIDPFSKVISFHAPMPSVWQGKYRLTKKDYFAASNARNTALCLAPDGWIAYVDDLSVLMPGWLSCVRQAMEKNYIVLGAYKKVLNLEVDSDGNATYTDFPAGVDSRWNSGHPDKPVIAAGSWLFGCSLAAPVEAFLKINGWDNDCNGSGYEDYIAGIMLEKAGYSFRYDRKMLTLESEERHHTDSSFVRFDKGVSPNDKSHAFLKLVLNGRHVAPNYFGDGGIRAVREKVLNGEPFPIIKVPDRDWYDGQLLSELNY